MSDELEPSLADQVARTDEDLAEFGSMPPDVRQAALEYARGLHHAGGVVQEGMPEGEPQFILVGVVQNGQHIIFASTQVKTTRFGRRVAGVDRVEVASGRFARIPRIVAVVGAEMGEFEQYLAQDYRHGLQSLLTEWDRKAMMRQRGLPPGR